MKTARENYYKSKLKDNAGDIKKTWETITSLVGKYNKQIQFLSRKCFK